MRRIGGPRRIGSRFLRIVLAPFAVWWAATEWLAPRLIAELHADRWPGGDLVMRGRDGIPLAAYLRDWAAHFPDWHFAFLNATLLVFLVVILLDRARPVEAEGRGAGLAGTGTAPGGSEAPDADRALPSNPTPLHTGLLGAWFGLVCGLGETYYLAGRIELLGLQAPGFRYYSRDSLWMAPLVDIALFGLVGLTLGWALQRDTSRRRLGIPLTLFAFLTLLVWTSQTGRLYGWAGTVLCLGVAYRLATTALGSLERYTGLLRPTARFGMAVLAALMLWTVLAPVARERRQVAGLPDAPPRAPNVLLIVLDTQRARSTGLNDPALGTTPRLERLATRGTVFTRAFATSSWTLPSHGSMFTGLPDRRLGTDPFTPLGDEFLTLAEFLGSRGYRTAGFAANILFVTDVYGLDQGFQRFEDQPRSPRMALASARLVRVAWAAVRERRGRWTELVRKRAPEVTREFLDWLDARGDERPFFAFLNYFDVHAPYDSPDAIDRRSSTDDAMMPWYDRGTDASRYSPDEIDALHEAYLAGIRYLDREIGALVDTLEARGLMDSTLVVITSDHGESFGEHGHLGHQNGLYRQEIEVPLLVLDPRRPSRREIEYPVSLIDLPATVVEYVGLESPFRGSSLLAPRSAPAPVRAQLEGGWESAVIGNLHYVQRPDGTEEVYDLDRDDRETNNLVGAVDSTTLHALRSVRRPVVAALPDAPLFAGRRPSPLPVGSPGG